MKADGAYFEIKQVFWVAELFNPLVAKTAALESLHAQAEGLKNIVCLSEFTQSPLFLQSIKDKIGQHHKYYKDTTPEDWAALPMAKEYNKLLHAKVKVRAVCDGKSWTDDLRVVED